MASKIMRAGSEVEVQPMRWRRAGAGALEPIQDARLTASAGSWPPGVAGGLAPEEIEKRLRAEADRVGREAYEQGRAAGRQEAMAEVDRLVKQLAQSIEMLAGMKPRLRQEAERDVVGLSLSIARRVLRREVQVDRDAVLGLVKAAFEHTSLREVLEVRVHSAHAPRIREYLAAIGGPEAIEVRPDPQLEPGGVVVETNRGSLDASLDTQIDEIAHGLADVLEGGTAH
jgi:flagellar assembly protein FliH